jgi:hypothetical protein
LRGSSLGGLGWRLARCFSSSLFLVLAFLVGRQELLVDIRKDSSGTDGDIVKKFVQF